MRGWVREVALPAAAGALALAALGGVLWTELVALPAYRGRCAARREELAQLEQMAEAIARYAPHLSEVDAALGSAGPVRSPVELFAGVGSGVSPPAVSGERELILDEARAIRRVELAMPEVPVDVLAVFLHACATARPPWRVAALRLQALDAGSSRARVALTLEAPALRRQEELRRP
ncbi:MAG: hypothetical protein N2652_00315 [Kiritimatiellae bacterium]|nr:hypothetical protein [Kiritimatiellia bacterium]